MIHFIKKNYRKASNISNSKYANMKQDLSLPPVFSIKNYCSNQLFAGNNIFMRK